MRAAKVTRGKSVSMAFKRMFKNKNFNVGKRGRGMASGKYVGSAVGRKRRGPTVESLAKRVKLLHRTMETKSGTQQISDNILFQHNNPNIITSTFMNTGNGTLDQENAQGQRIGDKITLTGVSFKMMVELDEIYSDVTLRMMVVRSAKGDTPSISTLWQGN